MMTTENKKLPAYELREENGNYVMYRNAEMMKTPRGLSLSAPQAKLGNALLQECLAQQEERLDLRQMPMTQMTLTVIDIASTQRGNIIEGIMRYGDSELVCQRATDPADLIERQNRIWQPYIDWCQDKFGIELLTGNGIIPFKQNDQALAAISHFIETFEDYHLVGISEAVGISGSLILGLALLSRYADAQAIFEAAELDQLWQSTKWGSDPETEARHEEIKRDLIDCARWFDLIS